mmetsp:Transcript_20072/g.37310  ORF Transcript_20072/g.37310 Transcript_20072/m.37310 type:complete len:745 (-) Transcript_20072:255-2489(-)
MDPSSSRGVLARRELRAVGNGQVPFSTPQRVDLLFCSVSSCAASSFARGASRGRARSMLRTLRRLYDGNARSNQRDGGGGSAQAAQRAAQAALRAVPSRIEGESPRAAAATAKLLQAWREAASGGCTPGPVSAVTVLVEASVKRGSANPGASEGLHLNVEKAGKLAVANRIRSRGVSVDNESVVQLLYLLKNCSAVRVASLDDVERLAPLACALLVGCRASVQESLRVLVLFVTRFNESFLFNRQRILDLVHMLRPSASHDQVGELVDVFAEQAIDDWFFGILPFNFALAFIGGGLSVGPQFYEYLCAVVLSEVLESRAVDLLPQDALNKYIASLESIERLLNAALTLLIKNQKAFLGQGNTPLHCRAYDWIGFDLDFTLAEYDKELTREIQFNAAMKHLESCNSPYLPRSQKTLTHDLDMFFHKGLVLDAKFGYVLALDQNACVTYGFCGLRPLLLEEMCEAGYLDKFRRVSQPLDAKMDAVAESKSTKRFLVLHTGFEQILAPLLVALLRELSEEQQANRAERLQVLDEVKTTAMFIQSRFCSYGLETALSQPGNLVVRPDKRVKTWLSKLKSRAGTHLFLLTNSDWEHADLVMSQLYGEKWPQLFDLVVVSASKRRFFDPTYDAALTVPRLPESVPASNVMQGGTVTRLASELAARTPGPSSDTPQRILYVGDHLEQDVQAPSALGGWATLAIAPPESLFALAPAAGDTLHDLPPSLLASFAALAAASCASILAASRRLPA